jgi:hypothetical protein
MKDAIHAPDCDPYWLNGSPQCHGTYTCNRCERLFGWCVGACDATPSLCDECANFVQEGVIE